MATRSGTNELLHFWMASTTVGLSKDGGLKTQTIEGEESMENTKCREYFGDCSTREHGVGDGMPPGFWKPDPGIGCASRARSPLPCKGAEIIGAKKDSAGC